MAKEEKKLCFVIAPIGEEGSEIRRRSDQVLKHIITPAAEECGYETVRADKISEPGMITSQVIQNLIDDALVIADLTGRNPNVFYELAIRHAVRKPIVQVIQQGEPIPFDVAQSRTIQVDHHDLDSAARCRDELAKQIRSVEKDPADVDTPLSVAIDLQSLRQSENPLEKSSADIIMMLQEIRAIIGESPPRFRIHPRTLDELFMMFDRLSTILDGPEGQKPTRATLDEARQVLRRFGHVLQMLMMESGISPGIFGDFVERRSSTKRSV